MGVSELFGIKKGDIVSITGSSGKTTLMFALASELRSFSVLVSTTTHIYFPKPELYDYICANGDINDVIPKTGVTVFGSGVTPDNKLSSPGSDKLNAIAPLFDCVLIESDGSKMKPLKAWNENEPVVVSKTDKTIGIINVRMVGAEISNKNIHRLEIFRQNFSGTDKTVTLHHLKRIVLHEDGLFKNSVGDRVLYINMVESDDEVILAKNLAQMLSGESNRPDKVIYGSVRNKSYIRIE